MFDKKHILQLLQNHYLFAGIAFDANHLIAVNGFQYGDTNENLLTQGSKFSNLFYLFPSSQLVSLFYNVMYFYTPPLPNLLDILLAALFKKSGVHNINTADDFPPIFLLSCMS